MTCAKKPTEAMIAICMDFLPDGQLYGLAGSSFQSHGASSAAASACPSDLIPSSTSLLLACAPGPLLASLSAKSVSWLSASGITLPVISCTGDGVRNAILGVGYKCMPAHGEICCGDCRCSSCSFMSSPWFSLGLGRARWVLTNRQLALDDDICRGRMFVAWGGSCNQLGSEAAACRSFWYICCMP